MRSGRIDVVSAGTASRQCWECRKFRLVCDLALPHCRKCVKNGKSCPGYGDQKPLQWVDGVTSRRRRKIAPGTAQLNEAIRTQSAIGDVQVDEWVRNLAAELDEVQQRWKSDVGKDQKFDYTKFEITSRRSIEMALATKFRTKEDGRSLLQLDDETLQRTLRYMTENRVPAYELQSETCEVVQAVQYFNNRIYPQLTQDQLATNPHYIIFPIPALHLLPPAVHHNLVVLTMSHFVYSLPSGQGSEIATAYAPKILHHRGATIREISERLSGKLKTNNGTLVSILMLMCCELQQNNSKGWRVHAGGLLRLFECRGGMMHIYHTTPTLHSMIVIFTYIVVFSNTGTRAQDQILPFPSVEEHVAIVKAIFAQLFPYCLVPPALFETLVRINYLRHQAANTQQDEHEQEEEEEQEQEENTPTALSIQAHALLSEIDTFSPRDWAQPGPKHDEWLTVGRMYKASLAVYCILSCQSFHLFPPTDARIAARLEAHADALFLHLREALAIPNFNRFLTWPLAVAGVLAADRGRGARAWIERELLGLSVAVGVYCPLRIRGMLRKYWDGGRRGWEVCFEEPQTFLA